MIIRNLKSSIVIFALLLGAVPSALAQTHGSSPNDRARFLAAMPLPDTSPLKKFEHLPAYKEHAEMLSTEWQNAHKIRWEAMTAWAQSEVRPNINMSLPLFYMFGGPDFLSAFLIYPEAPRYILCGLEAVGKVPPIEAWRDEQAAAAIKNIDSVLEYPLKHGFFVTSYMGGNLLKAEASGVLPLLYVFIVRSGSEITGVQYVGLSPSGDVTVIPGDDPAKMTGARGVKITFVRHKGAAPQELYYFRTDLSDKALEKDKRFLLYLEKYGRANSYLKAASCVMHTKEFVVIRDFLLAQSVSILQDDSGIPYHFFDPAVWKITLYGKYTGPIKSIAWAKQPDLRKAYEVAGAAKPITFKTGYGDQEMANLQFAVKNTTKAPFR